jgi:diacylglycerol kinase
MKQFILGRLASIKYVLKGMRILFTTEHAIISQSVVALLLVALGFYCDLARRDWMWLVFSIGLVLVVESLNTAVEQLCDFIHPEHHKKIGLIKDVAAGAVGMAALFAFIVMLFVFYL